MGRQNRILRFVSDYDYKFGDADADGIPEIILPYAGDTVIFLDPYGNIRFAFRRPPRLHLTTPCFGGTADTDGDGRAEIVFSGVMFIPRTTATKGDTTISVELRRAGVIAFDLSGNVVWELRLNRIHPPESLTSPFAFGTSCTVSFGDVDGDGFLEFSHDFWEELGSGCDYGYVSWLYTWEIPGITNWRIDWSGPAHDPWNTNNYDFWQANPPLVRESTGKAGSPVLSVFPNPGKGIITLNLEILSPSPVFLEAYDPAGRLVYSEKIECLGPGSHQLTIALKPGVYILRAQAEKESGETKAILVK